MGEISGRIVFALERQMANGAAGTINDEQGNESGKKQNIMLPA